VATLTNPGQIVITRRREVRVDKIERSYYRNVILESIELAQQKAENQHELLRLECGPFLQVSGGTLNSAVC
jgi:hypothetical protein